MQRGRGMWRDDPIVRVFIFLFWLIGPPVAVGIISLPIWAVCSWVGRGISFWKIFGFLYIAGTLILACISWEDLLRILRNCWHPWEWRHHHPLIVFLGHLLQLMFVLAVLAALAFIFTTAWNWIVMRLRLISFQDVLIILLIMALPYLMFLGWIDLGVGLLWRRRFWQEKKSRQDEMVLDDSGIHELADKLRAEGRLGEGKTPQFVRDLIARYREEGMISEEQALELAERWAELDDQEGLGEIEVITDEEE